MPSQTDGEALRKVAHKQFPILKCLSQSPKTIPELVSDSQRSRTTIDRGMNSLTQHQLIQKTDEKKYKLTTKGKLVKDEIEDYNALTDTLADTTDLICSLTDGEKIPRDIFRDAEYRLADPKAPETCLQPVADLLRSATQFQATSTVALTHFLDIVCSAVRDNNIEIKVTAEKHVIESMAQIRNKDLAQLCSNNCVSIFSIEKSIPYTGWVIDTPSREVGGFLVHSQGAVRGILMNNSKQTVEWLRAFCGGYQSDGTLVTESAIRGFYDKNHVDSYNFDNLF